MSYDASRRKRPGADALARRIRKIREESYGDRGIIALAQDLGIPERTWENYEGGVMVPGGVLLEFIEATSAEPRWLLTGQGPRYRASREADADGRGPAGVPSTRVSDGGHPHPSGPEASLKDDDSGRLRRFDPGTN